MALVALKRKTAEQMAAESLRSQIISGEILPGTRLTEVSLSEQLGISRGTLRIALYHLAQEGIIIQTPYSGWSTTSLAPEDLWELYTVRAGLEATAARLVCESLTPAMAAELEATFDELRDACENSKMHLIAEKDFLFHKKIVELSANKRLAEYYRLVEQQIKIFVASTYNFVLSPGDVFDHHKPFLDALLQKNADEIDRLLREHAISEGKKLHAHLLSIQQEA